MVQCFLMIYSSFNIGWDGVIAVSISAFYFIFNFQLNYFYKHWWIELKCNSIIKSKQNNEINTYNQIVKGLCTLSI